MPLDLYVKQLGEHSVAVHEAFAEGHGLSIASPDEEAHLVGHCPAQPAKIFLGQSFEVQL
jgi:hypothetical protein